METQTEKIEAPKLTRIWEEKNIAQLVVFRVGPEIFAVPIEEIREIIQIGQITPIPDSPDFVKGIINVRGDIIPTIDLKVSFDLPFKEGLQSKHIMITRKEPNIFGLIVDEVSEVLRLPQTEIKPPPKLLTTIHEEYVSGVITVEKQLILLLDLTKVLSEEEIERLGVETRKHFGKETPKAKKKSPKKEAKENGEE